MKAQVQTRESSADGAVEAYAQVVSAIQKDQASAISVPELSRLLGVKPTTLNARFRRQQTALKTVGRTNFIPQQLALDLAALHKYALIGWPTLRQASHLTGVKSGTIKARCEQGRLEGYIDLTKRLRINPAALKTLHLSVGREPRNVPEPPVQAPLAVDSRRRGSYGPRPELVENPEAVEMPALAKRDQLTRKYAEPLARRPPAFVLPPVPEPQIKLLTPEDYGLLETEEQREAGVGEPDARRTKQKKAAWLNYDPDQPFSVGECRVGRWVRYGHHDGTIAKILDDPYTPKILVRFPEHQHPLMREVLLIVGKRRA